MKNTLVSLLIIFSFIALETRAQANKCDVVFPKFKLEWFNIMGMRGGSDGQRLKLSFKNTSDRVLKYVKVHYWAVNAVNDIVTDRFNRKDFSVNCTGPFKPKKNNKLEVEIALFYPNLLRAAPYKLEITYMDDEEKEIEIDKDNIKEIFPNTEYISIGDAENVDSKSRKEYGDDTYF